MINSNIITNAPSTSKVNAKVELYNGSTLVETCTCNDRLQDFVVERVGQSNKFFGFGVNHRLTVTLIDLERNLTITKDNSFKVYFGYDVEEEFVNPCPAFYAYEVKRDEDNNSITVVAYDSLYAANGATVEDLALEAPYTIRDVAEACGTALGIETVCGKNLWNNSKSGTNVTTELTKTETGFNFVRTGTARGYMFYNYIPVKAGETYTFSFDPVGQSRLYIYTDAPYGNAILTTAATYASYTFEEDYNAVFSIAIDSNVASLSVSNIQVEKSAVRTSYEPYLAAFDISYPAGANFEGTEKCKDVLNAIAEATQTIYYLDNTDKMIFKRLGSTSALTISKDDYYDLETGETKTLGAIVSVTELGDNVDAGDTSGDVQYIRNNPFWENRDDIHTLVSNALVATRDVSATPFSCEWDGNFLLEPGDYITLITEDDAEVKSYMVNDTISYNGVLSEYTQWTLEDKEETASSPASLGEVLNRTFARVDKVDKEITLHASEIYDENGASKIAELIIDTDKVLTAVYGKDGESGLAKKVETMLTSEEFSINVKKEVEDGVGGISILDTGFVFDNQGLTITKTDSEMKTNIDENGLSVFQNSDEVLTADNKGVKARNLHATTYLTIGDRGDGEGRSKFADYGSERTGCFWVGK